MSDEANIILDEERAALEKSFQHECQLLHHHLLAVSAGAFTVEEIAFLLQTPTVYSDEHLGKLRCLEMRITEA